MSHMKSTDSVSTLQNQLKKNQKTTQKVVEAIVQVIKVYISAKEGYSFCYNFKYTTDIHLATAT